MCEIMEDLAKESEAEGIIKVGRLDNKSDEQIINDLIMICNKTKEEAQKDIKQYDFKFA